MTRQRRLRLRSLGLYASLTALVLTGACSADSAPARGAEGKETAASRIIQPGAPGEPAREVGPAAAEAHGDVGAADSWRHADAMFMQMMIPHHAQALEMSRLAQRRAHDPRVRMLAKRIHSAQGPEIRMMSDWLADRGLEVPRASEPADTHDHSEHGHAGMMGMLTESEMQRLATSRGRTFDRLFLRGMIKHHKGALTMVAKITPDGEDVLVQEMAADMAASQAAEINRMSDVLRSLAP